MGRNEALRAGTTEQVWTEEALQDAFQRLRDLESIVHPDDRERITSEVAQYTREGRTEFMQEYRIRSNSGKVRWLDDRVCVRRDASGNVTHYQGIVLDITDRKRAEEVLRRMSQGQAG